MKLSSTCSSSLPARVCWASTATESRPQLRGPAATRSPRARTVRRARSSRTQTSSCEMFDAVAYSCGHSSASACSGGVAGSGADCQRVSPSMRTDAGNGSENRAGSTGHHLLIAAVACLFSGLYLKRMPKRPGSRCTPRSYQVVVHPCRRSITRRCTTFCCAPTNAMRLHRSYRGASPECRTKQARASASAVPSCDFPVCVPCLDQLGIAGDVVPAVGPSGIAVQEPKDLAGDLLQRLALDQR